MKTGLSKAEALKKIKKNLNQNNILIPKFFYFTKKNFLKNKNKILNAINLKFNKEIIIRSSTYDEDTSAISNAGKYLSLTSDPKNKVSLESNITTIIKQFKNLNDQILVQEFIDKPLLSGVLFTKDKNLNSPYYIINYDKSGKTNLVTSGEKNPTFRSLIIFKQHKKIPKVFKDLIVASKNFEKIFQNDRLDIEFCLKKKKTYIFQCRPLHGSSSKFETKHLGPVLINIEKKISKIKKTNPTLSGNDTLLSNMSDWNPAEMIGDKPDPLAISLYSELITDRIWSIQRKNYGYKNVIPNQLMFSFAGSPYIDLRTDLNSFLPKNLSKKIENKIVNYCLYLLKKNPELHDKIEFEIINTCYDFEIKNRLKEFLSRKEIKVYSTALLNLTNKILNPKNEILKKEERLLEILENKIKIISKSRLSDIQKIYYYLEDCKSHGILPFSGIARCAFISTKILNSLKKEKIISNEDYSSFFESINSIANDISRNYYYFCKRKINKNKFLEKYGHLRPSTYSITSDNYKEGFKKYFSKKIDQPIKLKTKKLNWSKTKINKINKIFKKHNLIIKSNDFIRFARQSIYLREYAKFIFTKSIDKIFENLINLGKEIKIKRKDLAFLDIKNILKFHTVLDQKKLKFILEEEIQNGKKSKELLKHIKLSDLIKNSKDVYIQSLLSTKENYITENNIIADTIVLDEIKSYKILKNKVVLIDNADPGYDFIFTYNIKGLITKYGGSNSHMAIRCLELGIASIIGVGEEKFNTIKRCNKINLNCEQKFYRIIN